MTEARKLQPAFADEAALFPHRKECESMNRTPRTIEEFEAMPQKSGITYEFINGTMMMSPRPSVSHQKVSLKLAMTLHPLLKARNCDLVQEVDLLIDDTWLVPDLMITCGDKFEGKRHEKPPFIVIEIVSYSSACYDCITKLNKYKQLGVTEYWVVAPDEYRVQVIHFPTNTVLEFKTDRAEKTPDDANISSVMTSVALPDISIELNDIFE